VAVSVTDVPGSYQVVVREMATVPSPSGSHNVHFVGRQRFHETTQKREIAIRDEEFQGIALLRQHCPGGKVRTESGGAVIRTVEP